MRTSGSGSLSSAVTQVTIEGSPMSPSALSDALRTLLSTSRSLLTKAHRLDMGSFLWGGGGRFFSLVARARVVDLLLLFVLQAVQRFHGLETDRLVLIADRPVGDVGRHRVVADLLERPQRGETDVR